MPMTPEQFGQQIKAKYPDYADMPDADVASKVLQKYPQYQDLVQSATPNSSQGAGPHNATISASSPGFWESARNMIFNTSVGDAIRRNVPIAPDWMKSHLNPQTEDAERQHGQTISFEEMGRWGQNGAERPSGPRQAITRVLQTGSSFTTPGMMLGAAMLGPAAEVVAGAAPVIAPVAEHAIPLAFTGMAAYGAGQGVINEAQYGEAYLKAKGLLEEAQQKGDTDRADEIQKYLTHLHDAMWQTGGDVAANAAMAYLGRRGLPGMIKGFKGEGKFIGPRVDPTDHAYWEGMIPGSLRSRWAAGNTEATPQTARNPWGNLQKPGPPSMPPPPNVPPIRNPEQLNLPLEGNAIPEPPTQRSFDFSQLPEQKLVARGPEAEANGQLRLFPNEPRQMELRPEERPAGVPEGPSAQTAFQFPQNPWQMSLDFNQPVEAAPHQATNPSPEAEPTAKPTAKKRGNVAQALAMEKDFRPVVQTFVRIAQLSEAANKRIAVERALNKTAGTRLSDDDLKEYAETLGPEELEFLKNNLGRDNDNPLFSSSAEYNKLDPKDRSTVDVLSQLLGTSPEELKTNNWRLSDEQVVQLKAMKEEGLVPRKTESRSLAEPIHAPLAKINTPNVEAIGLPNARDLWSQVSPEAKAARIRYQELSRAAQERGSDATFDAFQTDADTGEAVSEWSSLSRREAGLAGAVSERPDLDRLEQEHEAMQEVLAKYQDRGHQWLQERIPSWEQKRSGTSKPSSLAQEVDALPDVVKAQLPKELYDPKHTGASTGNTAETSHVQEPVQGAKATETAPAAQATHVPANPEGQSPDLVTKIQTLAQSLRAEHGDSVRGAVSQIKDVLEDRGYQGENAHPWVLRALIRYGKALKEGQTDPLPALLAGLRRLKPYQEATLYSNPLGEIWNRAAKLEAPIGVEMPDGLEPHPLEHPIDSLMGSLGDKKSQTVFQRIGNWVSNEALKAVRIARDLTPDLQGQWAAAKVGFDKIRAALKSPFETWKDLRYRFAPGPSALQALKFQKQVDLLESSMHFSSFDNALRGAIPDKMERSGFAVWTEAHRGPEGPLQEGQESLRLPDAEAEDTVRKQLAQLEARPGGKNSYEARVWRAALNLSKESKDFLQSYRNYDKLMGQQDAEAGVPHEMLEDYWQHVYKQPGLVNSIVGAFKSSVGWQTKASFQKMRTHMSYFDAVMAGLKPVDLDASFLISNRATASAKVIANRHFLEGLRNVKWEDGLPIAQLRGVGTSSDLGTLIKPDISTGKTADGTPYVVSPHPSLRGWKWLANAPEGTPTFGLTDLEIHPEAWKQMKADFESSWWKSNPTGRALMRANIALKTSKLAYSIFHPVALAQHAAARTALAKLRGVHTEMSLPDGTSIDPSLRMLMPWDDKFKIDPNDATQRMLLLAGLNISPENLQSMYGSGGPGIQKVPFMGAIASIIHDYTTHSVIPKFAMGSAITNFHTNLARFYEDFQSRALQEMSHNSVASAPQEAVKQANDVAMWKIARMSAKQANYSNGLTPLTDIPGFRGATAADTARFFLLAPQFLFNRGMLMLDAAKPGGAQTLQSMAVQGLATYTFCYGVNKLTQGADWEPDIHTWNKIIIGKEGEARHEFTMRSELSDAVDLYDDPRRFMQYRLAPSERPVADAVTGKDVYENQITKTQMSLDAITAGSPIPIEGFADLLAPHYDATLRATKGSDAVFNGLAASLGFRRGQYRTTTERMINQNFNAIKAPQTTDELALEQKATFRQLRDKYRQGQLQPDDIEKAVNDPNGNLKATEIPYLFRTATQPRFVTQAEHLEYGQVLSAWQKGTTLEKYALLPVLEKKVATLAPSVQTEAIDRLENFRNSLSEEKQAELQTLLQKKLEVENPK